MKIIIQRVLSAKVIEKETDKIVGSIGKGLFLLLGVRKNDTDANVDILAKKVLELRIMSDQNEKMNFSIKDARGEILVVSQFTLFANTNDGRRPSFIDAANPEVAKDLYEKFINKLKESGLIVENGSFGNYMRIESVADGPVTIILEA